MWDQTQGTAGGEKGKGLHGSLWRKMLLCACFWIKRIFCTSALCLERGNNFLANLVWGKAHNGSAETPLCPADHCPGWDWFSADFSSHPGIYFSLDEEKVWSQSPDQVPVFVPCKSKLFSKTMAKYSFPDSWRSWQAEMQLMHCVEWSALPWSLLSPTVTEVSGTTPINFNDAESTLNG